MRKGTDRRYLPCSESLTYKEKETLRERRKERESDVKDTYISTGSKRQSLLGEKKLSFLPSLEGGGASGGGGVGVRRATDEGGGIREEIKLLTRVWKLNILWTGKRRVGGRGGRLKRIDNGKNSSGAAIGTILHHTTSRKEGESMRKRRYTYSKLLKGSMCRMTRKEQGESLSTTKKKGEGGGEQLKEQLLRSPSMQAF